MTESSFDGTMKPGYLQVNVTQSDVERNLMCTNLYPGSLIIEKNYHGVRHGFSLKYFYGSVFGLFTVCYRWWYLEELRINQWSRAKEDIFVKNILNFPF